MLGRVVVENGVKKIVPLTADCGSGNPVGTVIAVYSNKVPNGYLPCNGVAFDTAQFPVLYALLGDNHTPDLRECTLKGIGESGRAVGSHVKAGGLAVGEFVDDRVQDLTVRLRVGTGSQGDALAMTGSTDDYENRLGNITTLGARTGATTEVKAVGVNWCIKATSGINENQADNVLSALTPVDTVASGDMHAVTSNAVAEKLIDYQSKEWKILKGYNISGIEYDEVAVSVWFKHANTEVVYSKQFSKGMLGDTQVLVIGGYYISADDYGLCNLNFTNGLFGLRNVYYAGQNFKSASGMRIRYR